MLYGYVDKTMLKNNLYKTTAAALALVVLISTSGFTVFQHSCSSNNTSELSFIVPLFSCDHYQADHMESEGSCCVDAEAGSSPSCRAGDCCDTETTLVKLDVTFEIQIAKIKIFVPAIDLPMEGKEEPIKDSGQAVHPDPGNDLPPPLSGKDLRIYLHQLNTLPMFV